MNKKHIKIILNVVIGILLIATGIYITLNYYSNTNNNETIKHNAAERKDTTKIILLGKYFTAFDKKEFTVINDNSYIDSITSFMPRVESIMIQNLYEAYKLRIEMGEEYYELIDRSQKINYNLWYIWKSMEYPTERGSGDLIGYPIKEITEKIYNDIIKNKNVVDSMMKTLIEIDRINAGNILRQICQERYNFIKDEEWSEYPQKEIEEIYKLLDDNYLIMLLNDWIKLHYTDMWIQNEN